MDELITQSNITPNENKTLYPLIVFDVSMQRKLKSSAGDIQIKAQFTENAPFNTKAFAVIFSDKMLSFQPHGKKMSVIC